MTLGNAMVTGGGGFLGKALVRKLVDKGETVFSFSRSRYSELDKLGVYQIQGDLTDAGAVANALKGMDTVFHTAAKPGIWGDYDEYFRINVTGTVHVIDACMKNKVGQMIHTSSPSVVFDDKDMHGANEFVPYPDKYLAPYPETKALAEKEVIKAAGKGLSVIILRPHLIWGPEDNHLLPGIIRRASRLKIIGPDNDLVDTIYVDNAADAHILAAEKLSQNPDLSGNIYFISQDAPISKWTLANAFLAAAGLPPIKGHVSGNTAYAAGWLFEFIYRILGIKRDPPMTRFAAKELATSHWFDISRAKNDLGYVPKISTREGLKRLEAWLKRK
ncbi:MAG: NAD-dependent epimerase/dehydratase family protein [Desulfobacter postgatei]|jgi:nucleoside-diphosphate-sugar epimerase|uniref:NAD-dependent epimerase/dehydratase family protein n=1 Tax=Desulfobacter postgatei TaxID=2293 RepID=UPI0023F564B5|nr:NAD-dependent epimerase/dehydratase family protein [Desulfobacter postgatei]MDD4274133.1 NAD-dependent epimerase/dehydratase family protein [Desulfobacter postgatei]MDX9962819.1 NAD-dependent epimerase/dehydratase family protein [Desulfobacter postgatei]